MESLNIKDVAGICGVSVSTVSRTLNGSAKVSPEKRKLILDVIRKYNYVPNNSARNLKMSQSSAVCVLVKGIYNPFFNEMLGVIQDRCSFYGYDVMITQIGNGGSELDTAFEQAKEKKPLGLLLLGGAVDNSKGFFDSLSVPVVLVATDRTMNLETEKYSSIYIDDRAASFSAVEYLIERGHRNIGFVIAERRENSIMSQRLLGYKDALRAHGLPYSEEYVIDAQGFSYRSGYTSFMELLGRGVDETAVFCISDTLAIGVAKAALDRGLRIPEDISIVGFDGIEQTKYYNPVLTTVLQPYRQMAYEAVETLRSVIDGGAHQHKCFPTRIIEGRSVLKIG